MTRSRTSHRRGAALAALVAVASAGCADGRSPTGVTIAPEAALPAKQSTTASRMLYYDFGNVWIMNDDGSGVTPLLLPSDQAFDPSWAPDGKRVLFNAYRGEAEASIYSMNADGTQITRITRPPAGSIDVRPIAFGKQVVFVRWGSSPATTGIFRINVDGSDETKLIDGTEPASAPGGGRLAYSNGGDIHEYDAATGTSKNLTNTPAIHEGDPSYSPNGKLITFVASSTGVGELFVMRADGTALTRLASSNVDGFGTPKWSPDGKRIAFSRYVGGTPDIQVMNSDGTGLQNLTTTATTSEILTAWGR